METSGQYDKCETALDNAGLEEEEENMLEGSRAGDGRAGVALAS